MNNDFLKPPPFSTWLLLAVCGLLIFGSSLGSLYDTVVPGAIYLGGIYALYRITRWGGRIIGYCLAGFSQGVTEGYHETRAKLRQRDAEREGTP